MWFEIDGHALVVTATDGNRHPALDAVPLPLRRDELSLPVAGALSFETCSAAELQSVAATAMAGEGQRLRLPAAPGNGLEVEVLTRPTEAVLLCPGHGLTRVSSDGTHAQVLVTDPDGLPAGAIAASAVLAMIAERGFSPIHASLVNLEGVGVMFCGERSRGKTSSCLALARGGWTVRADDRCFLRVRDGQPVVWGPGGEMSLRPDAVNLWPDLSRPMAEGRDGSGKRVVELAAVGGHAAAGSVVCHALMFPNVTGAQPHQIEPMPKAEALGEMLFSTGLAALPEHAALQFRDLAALLEQTPCYRLGLGRDMDELPRTIAEVLA